MSKQDATCARSKTPRRERSSKPGIYFRTDSKGARVYEYTYRDAIGKQHWPGGFRTLKEAEDAKSEVMRRLRRGERVAPIKARFGDFADMWLESQTQLRPSTRARYDWAIRSHLKPRFGRMKLPDITEDHVAYLIADMTRDGYASSTIKAVINPLSLILGRAVRRGAVATNAVAGLERAERPVGRTRDMRILERHEIGLLIDATAPESRALIATLIFCGLRISEALGLVWSDVDVNKGLIHVRRQLDHVTRQRVELKTKNARRSIVMMPALSKMLAARRLASHYAAVDAPVFTTAVGTPLNRDNVRTRVLAPAVKGAGLEGDGRPRLRTHDLRHTFASMLIAEGASVVFVSRQMGHGSPAITLTTYSHLFDERDHAEKMSAMMEAGYGATLDIAAPEEVTTPTLRPVAVGA